MIRITFWSMLWTLLLALGQIAQAKQSAIIESPVRIPLGQTHEWKFGVTPPNNGTVALKISSRLDAKGLGGSMFFMKLRLNGQEVLSAKRRFAVRLMNKSMTSPVSEGVSGSWFSEKQGWRVIYARNFEVALSQSFYEANPYEIVLDVTDLVVPNAENRLEITNTATESAKKYAGTEAELVIGKLGLETIATPSVMTVAGQEPPAVINRGEPAAGAAPYRGEILPGGGFTISVGQKTYKFNSAFSYPNAGFNRLAAGAINREGQSNWRVTLDKKAGRVVAQGTDYRIARTIKFGKTHAEIMDEITNLHSDAPLGLAVRNEMELVGLNNPQIRLAGNTDPLVNDYYAPGNPSVHVRLPKSAIGIIAEDDLFRNQALLYANPAQKTAPAVAGIRTEMLRLPPGKSYSLRWAVYPVAGPDYYDFVNLVRRDWGANFTTTGAWWWGFLPDSVLEMPVPELRELLLQNGIRYANFDGGWIDRMDKTPSKQIGFGAGVFDDYWASYRGRIRAASEKLHQALPEIKVLGYYDVQQDTSENSPQKFPDSWLTNSQGTQMYANFPGYANTFYSVVPTLENSFGKAALRAAQRYMDEMKLDGLYWDEMDNVTYGRPRLTYSMYDGYSCQLDPKSWTIVREVGVAPLLSASFRKAVIAETQKRDGVILGNTPTGSLSELRSGIMRMVEIQNNDINHYQGNLGTPLGYIGTHNKWESFLRALNCAMLPVPIMPRDREGHYLNLSHDIMPHLFPFTPVELHAGYLLGQERIIATHDGNYGWAGTHSLAQTRHFDREGKLTAIQFPIHCTTREARSAVKLSEKEAVVLEKIPVTFTPSSKGDSASWNAVLTVARYDRDSLVLNALAPHGGAVTVRSGTLSLKNGQSVKVILQSKTFGESVRETSIKNGGITISLPKNFEGMCKLSVVQK